MSPDDALVRLAERTAQALGGVLETSAPGAVQPGEVTVLAAQAEPLADFPAPFVATNVSYVDGVTGGNVVVMTTAGAKRLAAAMTGQDPLAVDVAAPLEELELSAVSEAMNEVMAAAAGATSDVLGTEVEISPPTTREVREGQPAGDLCPPAPHATATALSVFGEPARLVQLVPTSVAARLTAALDELGIEATVGGDPSGGPGSLSLSGITMRLTAELGRARMPAGRAVALAHGAVVELDADVEAPIDLFVNGVRFATGRLLVTEDGDWAVRVEDVIAPHAIASPSRAW